MWEGWEERVGEIGLRVWGSGSPSYCIVNHNLVFSMVEPKTSAFQLSLYSVLQFRSTNSVFFKQGFRTSSCSFCLYSRMFLYSFFHIYLWNFITKCFGILVLLEFLAFRESNYPSLDFLLSS